MSIRTHVEYSAGKIHGYVDLGCRSADDSLPPARDTLVLVAIDEAWKVPITYFFIDALTGEERGNVIVKCLQRLKNAGVCTVSLTCDGPSCHFCNVKGSWSRFKCKFNEALIH